MTAKLRETFVSSASIEVGSVRRNDYVCANRFNAGFRWKNWRCVRSSRLLDYARILRSDWLGRQLKGLTKIYTGKIPLNVNYYGLNDWDCATAEVSSEGGYPWLVASAQPPRGNRRRGRGQDGDRDESDEVNDDSDEEDSSENVDFDGDAEALKWALRQLVDSAKRMARTEAAADRKITNLLEYVRVYEDLENLNDVDAISKDVPDDTKEAFKRTVLGILGTLPQDGFEIQITTNREAFSKLLLSSMITGYTYHAAEVRMRMDEKFDVFSWTMGVRPIDPISSEQSREKPAEVSKDHVEKERKVVGGKVLIHGREISAQEYIEMLESRLGLYLTDRIMLLDYMRQIGVERLVALQADLRGEVAETMHELVRSIVGKLGGDVMGGIFSGGENIVRNRILTTLFGKNSDASDKESGSIPHYKGVSVTIVSSREYLAHLILWALAVGYRIRGIETLLQIRQSCTARPGEDDTT
ncbi:hypothetical protein CCYA_CCYA18G4560 [Cyanidiococcus yangmingshanensis]|nr:hypothetical protein CCYA_CCYA18G4560 [Cyanidiococcus yangmingshanensis]